MNDKTLPFITIVVLIAVGVLTAVLIGTGNATPAEQSTPAMAQHEGLTIETRKEGAGAAAVSGNTVSVHYVGTLLDGKKFDSSRGRGEPFSFSLGAGYVIRGWDLGVVGMKVGEVRTLTIAPELAYGPADGGHPLAGQTLVFEIELLAIQ